MIGNLEPEENVMGTGDVFEQLSNTLRKLENDNPGWTSGDELKVCIAGTLKKDKFIVIQNTTKRGQTK